MTDSHASASQPVPASSGAPTGQPLAVIMAAGRGTRMGGDLPKVLFEAAGKPLVRWVLDSLAAAGVIEERLRRVALSARLPVVIVCGDSPMLRPASVTGLLARFDELHADCLLGTAVTDDPAGLGRIVRDAAGRFERIVEERDASPAQRLIREVNMSTYVFEARALLHALTRLGNTNAAGEYYITDCPGLLLAAGRTVAAVDCLDASETLSVNTPEQLALVSAALTAR